jgi:hypothetical protein
VHRGNGADDRLHPVGQIRQQDRSRALPRHNRLTVLVHRLEQEPIGVDVEPAILALVGDTQEFRGGADVVCRTSEGSAEIARGSSRLAFQMFQTVLSRFGWL